MKSRTAPRILTFVAVFTMVAAAIGFAVTMLAGVFSSDYATYGEVPIPGTRTLHLPAGEATVTFHTVLVGGSGNSLPVPPLSYRISGPGGSDLQLTEDYGSTTTVNNDARVRIGYLQVPADGDYDVELSGNVSAYLNPTVAFGHDSGYGKLPWIMAALFGFGVVDLVIARIWASRSRRSDFVPSPTPTPTPNWTPTVVPTQFGQPTGSFTPSDEGIRVQTLNTLARLRDSGALTQEEYEAEKKRVLDGR
ncbi:MAG: hypothetical protein JWR11_1837 [Mycobacterium sp.]|jgi:hypothetical protein|nr:hypothetical protein [Mycobacterium sp.]MDT5180454.1 hypothetical protein [Mycobacterium sp.]